MTFYGDLVSPAVWLNNGGGYFISMPTAIFVVYTKDGFVIGADGRTRKGELPNAEKICDTAQKIFCIENPGRSLAYALAGTVGISDINDKSMVVDLRSEIDGAVKSLAAKEFVEAQFYIRKVCRPAYDALIRAKQGGQIIYPNNPAEGGVNQPGTTIARVLFVGYYQGTPVSFSVRFFHRDQKLGVFQLDPITLGPGGECGYGSQLVWQAMKNAKDKRFKNYRPHRASARESTMILQAVEIVRQHILVCSDPQALLMDPLICSGIGGHIHIAEINPNGFKWHIPPI